MLFWLSVPESAGSRGYYGNIGDIRNSGVEISLQGTPIRTRNFEWSLNFNITHNKDKILSLPEAKIAGLGGYQDSNKWFRVGGSLYNYMLADYAGVNEYGEALYWVDASYLNFQSFTLGYTLPKRWTNSLGVEKLRLYASGQNLCFWSARKGLDPRYNYDETTTVSVYSPTRTIMGDIQLTF